MTIEFEFVQDFNKYRDYVSFITKVEDATGLLPFRFYQGDMKNIYVIERKDNSLTVTLTEKTDDLVAKFKELAQPDTFNDIPEGVAYLYDIDNHELIYNFAERSAASTLDWSNYPGTYWCAEEDKYDVGLMLDKFNKVHRVFLGNTSLVSLLVGLTDLNTAIANVWMDETAELVPEPVGVHTVLAIIADQLGQDVPKPHDVQKAISNNMISPVFAKSKEYNVKNLVTMFDMSTDDTDIYWEEQWGAALESAIARDDARDASCIIVPKSTLPNQLCVSDLIELPEVPEADKPVYVHLDIPIHGIHYMLINPGQKLCIWFDDLLISPAEIKETLDNLSPDDMEFYPEYGSLDDGTEVR